LEPEFGQCSAKHLKAAETNLRQRFVITGCSERFDETLVLATRKLGWNNLPLYLPRLVNRGKPRRDNLSERTRSLIEERNEFDLRLHATANELLQEAIDAEGPEFGEQLQRFKTLNREHAERYQAEITRMGIGDNNLND
jgi:hypothetical protein